MARPVNTQELDRSEGSYSRAFPGREVVTQAAASLVSSIADTYLTAGSVSQEGGH